MSDSARSIAAVYERYHQSLYRFCFSIVGNAEDAQDALQNAMLKAIRALSGEQREIQLKPWLYRIAHNESIEILRKRRDEAQIDAELIASTAGPEETAAMRERLRRLLADVGELPERQRGALVMRELAGLGFGEIGEALGTSEAVARQTVYEARLGLRQLKAGREMSCESVMRQISDADGRTMRRRDIRAHLRACAACREFQDAIDGRSRDFAAIAPLPAAASAAVLHAALGSAGGHAATGAGAASTIGAGAGKAVATSAVLKSAATVAVVAAIGVGAADRSGVIHVGLSGGDAGTALSADEAASGSPSAATGATASSSTDSATAGATGGAAGVAAKQGLSAAGEGHGKGTTPPGATGPQGAEPAHGQPTGLPSSQHGQETAATHKATPHAAGTTHGHGHGATEAHGASRGHSHPHAALHSHHAHHSVHVHPVKAHSHSGGGSLTGPKQQAPPAAAESPGRQPDAETAPEAKAGGGRSVESSP